MILQSIWNMRDPESPTAETQNKPPGKQTSSEAQKSSPKHIFWIVPAFNVTYQTKFEPLTTRGKFSEWWDSTYDPRGLALYAFESATLEHSRNGRVLRLRQRVGRIREMLCRDGVGCQHLQFLRRLPIPGNLAPGPEILPVGTGQFRQAALLCHIACIRHSL